MLKRQGSPSRNLGQTKLIVEEASMSSVPQENLTVVLSPSIVAFVQREAAAHGGIDPSEFVNRVLAEAEKRRAQEILDGLLIEGLESGEPIPVTPEYWEGKRRSLDEYAVRKQNGNPQ